MAVSAAKKRLKAVANRISARSRIAIGLVFLLVAVLWLAASMGLIPSDRDALIAGRAKFSVALAIYGSAFVERDDLASFEATLRAVVARSDGDVLSAAVRREDGKVLVEIGDHINNWEKSALASHIKVPLEVNGKKWGAVEVRFRPSDTDGLIGYARSPQIRLIAFVASACMVLFLLYLRKMLQHLDPSKVVPSRVRSALDTLAEGLIVVDDHERIVLANQAFASIVGRTPDDLMGTRASNLSWIRDSAAAGDFPWTRAVKEHKPLRDVVMRMTDSQSNRRTFTVNCSPVLGHDGAYRGVLTSFDDVTQLENKEIELRKSKDVAESANRAKSEFLARMSHEIRTPMNAILGFAEVLRRGYEENEDQRQEYLDTIRSSGQHLLELINDILDLSKIEAGKLEVELGRCSPHQIMVETLSILSVRAKQKGLSLKLDWDSAAPDTIETDATRLRQVITNLVGNAIKFTDAGSVRLAARVDQAGAEPLLIVDVIDTGIGMKPEALGRVFQPFAQADSSITRRFGGTGLGLSISRQIAEALGGGLSVSSEYGKGSVFTITVKTGSLDGVRMIPAREIDATIASARRVEGPEIKLPAVRVLLVEDGISNRKLIMLVLQRAGAIVDFAEDGQAGSDMALAGKHDLVLMDMQMPVMDGYTAANLLRRVGYKKPIIALTAHAMHGDEEKCRDAGCTGFLTKPIDMDLLLRTVAEAAGVATVSQVSGGRNQAESTHARDGGAAGSSMPSSSSSARKSLFGKAPVPAPLAAGPLSPTELPHLKSSLPSDDPEFCQIIVEFVDRLHEQLGAMEQAWAHQDLSELASLAHWLKGSGGTAGFNALTDPARKLEQLAREKRIEEIGGAIRGLQELADRIETPAIQMPESRKATEQSPSTNLP